MNQSGALPVYDDTATTAGPARAPTTTTEAARPRRRRAVRALLSGLLVIVVLSHGTDALLRAAGLFPAHGQPMSDAQFLFAACYRTLFGVLGCYLTARLAPQRPQAYAVGLGCFGFFLSLLGVLATWNAGPEMGPLWYPLALVLTAIPAGWLGGHLLLWQQSRSH